MEKAFLLQTFFRLFSEGVATYFFVFFVCNILFSKHLIITTIYIANTSFATLQATINPIKMNATHEKRLIYKRDVY